MRKLYISATIFLILALGGIPRPGAGNDVISEPIEWDKTEPEFQKFIKALQDAADGKKPFPIYRVISPAYQIERDFGGMFNPTVNAVVNFSWSFPFDDELLFPEYKGHGWAAFKEKMSHKLFDTMPRGELCAPSGAMVDLPVPSGQLCFGKTTHGDWQITRHILGGD